VLAIPRGFEKVVSIMRQIRLTGGISTGYGQAMDIVSPQNDKAIRKDLAAKFKASGDVATSSTFEACLNQVDPMIGIDALVRGCTADKPFIDSSRKKSKLTHIPDTSNQIRAGSALCELHIKIAGFGNETGPSTIQIYVNELRYRQQLREQAEAEKDE